MQHASAMELFARLGLRRDGDSWFAPDGQIVSLYLAHGAQSLVLDRIASLVVTGDVAIVTTARKEVVGVELGDLRALRLTPESSGPGYR